MRKAKIIFPILTLLFLVLNWISTNIKFYELTLVCMICIPLFVVATVGIWIVVAINYIQKSINKKKISGYLIFTIFNIIVIIGTLIFALYDVNTSTGFMLDGLLGGLILYYGVPLLCIPLIINIILWIMHKNRTNKL